MFLVWHRVRVNLQLEIWFLWYCCDIFSFLFPVFGVVCVGHLFGFLCCFGVVVLCFVCPMWPVSLYCPLFFRFSLTFYVAAIPFNISVVLVSNTGQYTRYMHALLYCMRLDYYCSSGLYKLSGFFLSCLAPSKTFASYISGIDMVIFYVVVKMSASYYITPLNWISIVLGNWKAIHR